jgi:RNA polymerase sigma-70 factor, ECF subfamily
MARTDQGLRDAHMPQPLQASLEGASVQGWSLSGTNPAETPLIRAFTRSAISSTSRSISSAMDLVAYQQVPKISRGFTNERFPCHHLLIVVNTGKLQVVAPPPSESPQLLQRCQVGEREALGEFYRLYRPEVVRNLHRVLGPGRGDLEDVLQDVFIEVFRSIGRFRGDSKLSTWLYRVCVNVALQRLRKRKRLSEVPHDSIGENVPESTNNHTPEGDLDAQRRLKAVYTILDRLSPKKRVVFILHEIEGREPKEIADIVGAPVLTVRTRLHYARKEFYAFVAREPKLDGGRA